MARVLWRDAQGKEGTVVLSREEVRIGRAADCEICTEDGMVSRYHARIIRKGPAYLVEDMGSANGIFFEERQVKQHPLAHGDAVRCGSLWIRFVDAADAARPEPARPEPARPEPARPEPARPEPARPEPARGVRGTMVLPQPTSAPASAGQPETLPPAPQAAPPASAHATAPDPRDGEAEQEIRLLRRRVDQLQLELRTLRATKGGPDQAKTLENLESDLFEMTADRDRLRDDVAALQTQLDARSKDEELGQARRVVNTAAEVSEQLQDVLASLRVELIAAADEFEEYAAELPRASFELIRQGIRDASRYAEKSRELVRTLASLAPRE